jgi:hypothetical protein
MKKIALLLITTISLGCGSLNQQYVEADRATFDTLSPWIQAQNPPQHIEDVRQTWEIRLQKGEAEVKHDE